MPNFRRSIVRIPILGDIVLITYRFILALRYFIKPIRAVFVWLFRSREYANFTYSLTNSNKRYLIATLSDLLSMPYAEIEKFIYEIENDVRLKEHILLKTKTSAERKFADVEIKFCRRIGWYAIVRATKPKIVIETGVDKGLGSCVLTSALIKNSEEGFPGYYYGTDINPKAGYLLDGKYKEYGKILYGDSITSLKQLNDQIDLFINDSDHSAEYEKREYETVAQKLSPNAIILGDNAHDNNELLDFALLTGRHFIFFKEVPENHWYPGAGIGIAFKRLP